MSQQVRGVVAMTKGAPVSIETIVIPDPGPGEAVVKIAACGVCHTDLHYREGGINDEFPFLLGHEAAGHVESVGAGVTDLAPGDFVILNWRAVCGTCRSCKRGRPWYCFSTFNATQKMTLLDGTVLSPALGSQGLLELELSNAPPRGVGVRLVASDGRTLERLNVEPKSQLLVRVPLRHPAFRILVEGVDEGGWPFQRMQAPLTTVASPAP